MAEELRKRNTDCVYFLASPLTCKKGFDCEYRHNEIARLNPRDCYYWLAGNCLNAACCFRHPPMDGPAGPVIESSQCSVQVNKTHVPCYFYFNGFCSKGETCSFMHGNFVRTTAKTSTKDGFPKSSTFSSEDITASANKKESASSDTFTSSSEKVTTATIEMAFQRKEALGKSSVKDTTQQSADAQISMSKCEEVAVPEPVSLFSVEESTYTRSYALPDQSFEEPTMDHNEQENQWESSPGSDVLEDDQSENVELDDPEYLLSTDTEERELESEFCRNNFEELISYEPMYSDVELLDEHEMHRCSDSESEPGFLNDRKTISCSRENMLDSMFFHKRELKLVNLDAEEWNHHHLRNHLQRHSVYGNHSMIGLSGGRNGFSSSTSQRFLKAQKHRLYRPSLERRLLSQKMNIGSLSENLTFSNRISRYGSFRYLRQQHIHRKHHDEYRRARRQFSSSKKPVSRNHRYNPKSVSFKGPKTLSQIKEEKRKVEEYGEFFYKGCRVRSAAAASADFKGPKPLSDILKDKQKLGFVKEIST